ncbi:hypothetical protein WDU94_008484, partial [Cyamophila willieti]
VVPDVNSEGKLFSGNCSSPKSCEEFGKRVDVGCSPKNSTHYECICNAGGLKMKEGQSCPAKKIIEGKLFPGSCSIERPCEYFGKVTDVGCEKHNNTHYKCKCNRNGSLMKEGETCSAKIYDPPQGNGVHKLKPIVLVGHTFNTQPTDVNLNPSQNLPTDVVPPIFDPNPYIAATVLISTFILFTLAIICCRRRKRWPHSKNPKPKEARQFGEIVMASFPFNKEMLDEDRYASNPLYTSSSINSSDVPILCRSDVTFSTEIGEGCFGKVYKGELTLNGATDVVAIKVLKDNASREVENDFMREVEIMSSFRQANILSLLGYVPKEPGKKAWMVFEFMPHGDLAEVLRGNSGHFQVNNPDLPKLNKEHLLYVSQQVAAGMKYLAEQRLFTGILLVGIV